MLAAEIAKTASADGAFLLRNVWIIAAIPAVSFLLILFFGKKMPKKGSEIGLLAVAACFALSVVAGVQWIDRTNNAGAHGEVTEDHGGEESEDHSEVPAEGDEEHGLAAADAVQVEFASSGAPTAVAAEEGEGEGHSSAAPVVNTGTWFEIGPLEITVGTLVDGLTVMMLFTVTLVSLLVHIYSLEYLKGDRRYTHYFAFLSLFTASMLLLVMSSSNFQLLMAWELVGLCSFALIGHWWEEVANSSAALKAFLTNRVGDIGLIIGTIILALSAGTTDILKINIAAVAGDIDHLVLLVASLCLMAAVMSKSGQIPLHTWLPDAMAGPTPVSALIHAATMVVAGVFMIARMYGVFWEGFSIGTSSINVMAVVGGLTTLVGASLAFVQRDIKKVLAYSTISQLGYMVMALGVGAWTAGVFHLFTHAFFKACLFLGAGSVSHAVHHSFDMKSDMGGLKRYMPTTYATFLIGSLALAGLPPLAGFWSKDEILAGAEYGQGNGYPLMLIMGIITAMLTAAYMTRVIYLTFHGEYRGHETPHESPRTITVPLIVLAFMALVAGFLNLPSTIADLLGVGGLAHQFETYVEPAAAHFPSIGHAEFSWPLAIGSTLVVLAGIGVSYFYYFVKVAQAGGTELADGPTSRSKLLKAGYGLLENKYYLDWLYTEKITGAVKGPLARAAYWFNQNVLDGVVDTAGKTAVTAGRFTYNSIDQAVIDGTVNSAGKASDSSGQFLRGMQTGKVQQYATYLFMGSAVLAGIFIVII